MVDREKWCALVVRQVRGQDTSGSGRGRMIRLVPTRRGVRIVQHDAVLSEVLAHPGPTHSIVDVLAAAVQAFAQGPRVALLGFEGGGMVGPLRAMGGRHALDAIDISNRSYGLFKQLCQSWCGSVAFYQEDAVAWLRSSRRRFHAIVEDLSIAQHREVVQPEMVWQTLPHLVRRRTHSNAVVVFNLLRPKGLSWDAVVSLVTRPFAAAHIVRLDDFENRIVLAGNQHGVASAREISRRLRAELKKIQSRLAGRIAVRSVKA